MQVSFTPGPWTRKDTACHDSEGEYCGTEHWVIGSDGSELACPDSVEDADLICAAPDLIRALGDAIPFLLDDTAPACRKVLRAAKEAIAKAVGA